MTFKTIHLQRKFIHKFNFANHLHKFNFANNLFCLVNSKWTYEYECNITIKRNRHSWPIWQVVFGRTKVYNSTKNTSYYWFWKMVAPLLCRQETSVSPFIYILPVTVKDASRAIDLLVNSPICGIF